MMDVKEFAGLYYVEGLVERLSLLRLTQDKFTCRRESYPENHDELVLSPGKEREKGTHQQLMVPFSCLSASSRSQVISRDLSTSSRP